MVRKTYSVPSDLPQRITNKLNKVIQEAINNFLLGYCKNVENEIMDTP